MCSSDLGIVTRNDREKGAFPETGGKVLAATWVSVAAYLFRIDPRLGQRKGFFVVGNNFVPVVDSSGRLADECRPERWSPVPCFMKLHSGK